MIVDEWMDENERVRLARDIYHRWRRESGLTYDKDCIFSDPPPIRVPTMFRWLTIPMPAMPVSPSEIEWARGVLGSK